uniref:putative disease resistance protein At3g14460 n=1 Tax=Erigeron canadensis TaxID=72917 RepID=UPI001CB91AFA|nr:putative disease resistance protein At3g14460 [Erigeron canadensis]XP_043625358.1 putative disease resistance protein At3g14460 [Erigeron canadensis]XP_043625359.1 putative disease resistance protein At3g14460 [Erigeron canadensis]XP_043625360.1 putative disease resistance protein At3g14460 [Erigeron canadensis]XP_043625361.1 putative disease resistance protein At3g14460 [Erigeron canadensis]XP_043625362.1 putative disease resistance protein At3g14460 [Erigeron canadensis]XP_043625364.1 pu
MAEIILSTLLSIVVEKVASATFNKISHSKEIQSHLKNLETSLPKIQALLNDAAEKEIQDERVKDWLNRLQHLAYDADDILDSLATDDAIDRDLTQEPGVVRRVRKLFNATFSSSATRIQSCKLNDISTKLQQLCDEKNDLGLTVKDKRSKNVNRIYQTSLFDSPNSIVGREVEKEIILKMLLGDEPCDQNNFSVIPIVGMGGIGKTTLARLLYNEPKVKQHFELKAWVCVSDEFDSFNISKVIYEATASEEKKEKKFLDLNLLQEALRIKLAGKRFLLVLDDVWSENIEDWNTLVPPFHAVAPGSKIIITTRKKQLLQQLGKDNPYHLNKLSPEDALSLFAQHSLGATNFNSYPTLRLYGEGIVQKCDGLPLALKSLGTSLKTRTNEEDWKELLDSKIWSLKDEGGILPALRLSYHELSASLKQMFAYSSLFPKDYVFEKEDLILLWMAEGFLHKSTIGDPMEMERLGEKYFDDLLSKSFFEYVDSDKSLFVMHDLMNDLATSIAGSFFVRLDIEMKNKTEEQSAKKYRHMSFVREKFMTGKKFEAFKRANSLRSFLAVPIVSRARWENFHLPNKILVDILPQLPLLRVLCLSNTWIDEVPESVGNLKHLRYLNLSYTPIKYLPDNICNLYNLQTLIVFGCLELSKLPANFSKLKNLRHFDIRDTPSLMNMPLGIGELKSLQTLTKISIGGENDFPISGLKNLKNLRRRVCIDGLDNLQNSDQAREVNLSQMKLSELVVRWSDVFDGSRNQRLEKEVLDVLKPHRDNFKNVEIMSYGGTEFPEWVGDSLFCKLIVVRMYKCRNCVFLPTLGQLPSLKKLYIESMDGVKEVSSELLGNGPATFPSLQFLRFEMMPLWKVWSINAVGVAVFPCLKELHISNCPNMARWEVWSADTDVGVFPCLEKLWIDNCPNLVKVSLEVLPMLKNLNVLNCRDALLRSLVSVASSVTHFSISSILGLSDEVWGGVVQYLGGVEELRIEKCKEIRNLSEISRREKFVRIGGEKKEEGSNLLPTSIRMLKIWGCKNLKHLSCPDTIETLDIHNCENLEHLSCPVNSIQELKIWDCRSVTSVSFRTEGGGWQKLKSLDIWGCNSELEKELEKQLLIIINSTNMMPILEVLRIHNWKDLKSIARFTCLFELTTLVIEDCERIESFPNFHNLTLLKHLRIAYCPSLDGPPSLTSGSGALSGIWPPKLDSLSMGKLKRPISEWGPLPTSLIELKLWGGFGSSLEDEEDVKSFPPLLLPYSLSSSLTRLLLFDFKKMERISSEGLQHLSSLQHLTISSCPKIKDLPKRLLSSLLSLEILYCDELKEKMMSKRGSYWHLISHIPQVDIN